MKRFARILGIVLVVLAGLAAAGITATIGWRPFIGPKSRAVTDRRFAPSAARLARGDYLVTTGQTPCILCHSELRATEAKRLEVVPGMSFSGRNWTPDGTPFLTAPNLTPDRDTGIGAWSDDQLARAIREGIGHDGRALFPIMPYEKFRSMTDEDLASVIVYLRAQAPITHPLAPSAVPFPLNRLINGVPQPVSGTVTADLSTPEKRGQYIVTIAVCADCHTTRGEQGERPPGLDFAGGTRLNFTGVPDVFAANITPAVNGIPYYNEELFIETMRTGRVRERELSSLMPTEYYRHMSDEDLKAIFAYLKTLPPVDHYVDNAMPPTDCPRCGLKHGGGERNKKPTT